VSGEPGEEISIRQFPSGLAFDGYYLWAVKTYDDSVQAINPASHAAVPPMRLTLRTKAGPGIAFDGQRIWVASEGDNSAQYVLVSREE
jgi:hypothetical protein